MKTNIENIMKTKLKIKFNDSFFVVHSPQGDRAQRLGQT